MKSLRSVGSQPQSLPIVADSIVEFHAARLLLLLHLCGVKGRIVGLTKLAKLDFFVRYPKFFVRACEHLNKPVESEELLEGVEANMIRYHYRPWDQRYYQILAYLEGRELITVDKESQAFNFQLTAQGRQAASTLEKQDAFSQLRSHMKSVKRVLGDKAGSTLKRLVYELFDEEVAQRSIGDPIS